MNTTTPRKPAAARLPADCRRGLAAARRVLGGPISGEAQAARVAREVAARLAALSPEARLADRRRLIALLDELMYVAHRLAGEREWVERRLAARLRHAAAGRAYRGGTVR